MLGILERFAQQWILALWPTGFSW